jgi:hypothetical protein
MKTIKIYKKIIAMALSCLAFGNVQAVAGFRWAALGQPAVLKLVNNSYQASLQGLTIGVNYLKNGAVLNQLGNLMSSYAAPESAEPLYDLMQQANSIEIPYSVYSAALVALTMIIAQNKLQKQK